MRGNSGPDEPPSGNGGNAEFWRLMTRYLPAIGLLPASVLAGYVLGYGLDCVFSTTFLRLVFMILGVVAGVVQFRRCVPEPDVPTDHCPICLLGSCMSHLKSDWNAQVAYPAAHLLFLRASCRCL